MINLMDMKQMIFMAVVLLMLVASCDRQPNKNNFPPDNANVALDSTNLPIVWVEVDGVTVDRFERIPAHMKIIYNGKATSIMPIRWPILVRALIMRVPLPCVIVVIPPSMPATRSLIHSARWKSP